MFNKIRKLFIQLFRCLYIFKMSDSERWSYKEIIDFLNICKRRQVLYNMKTKPSYRFDEIFCDVKGDMKNLGYTKSAYQMNIKLKKLRQRYKQGLMDKNIRRKFDFFGKINELEENCQINFTDGTTATTNHSNNELFKIQAEIFVDDAFKLESNLYDNDVTIPYTIRTTAENDHTYDQTSFDQNTTLNYQNQKQQNLIKQTNNNVVESNMDSKKKINLKRKNNTKEETTADESLNNFLVAFRKTQEELQKSFFKDQLELQKQQQEWEEKILDEEKEFITKILKPTAT